MKKISLISLIGFWVIFLSVSVLFFACGGNTPTSPSPPPQPEKYYTLQIQYIRTYINPDVGAARTVHLFLFKLGNPAESPDATLRITTDDYHLYGELWAKPHTDYYFHCQDISRYDGFDSSSAMVGDIFIITVKETGFTKELKDIRPYTLPTNLKPGPKAKAAFFQLTEDGRIISDPQ